MTETTNLHLTKDAETDYYSVARVNANSDKIDAFAGQVNTALSGKATPADIASAIGALNAASVGGTGKYISAISETGGVISATASQIDYTILINKPQINSVTLTGDKSSSDLGLASAADVAAKADKATTLSGYGITDAKIASGTITLGSQTITPITQLPIASSSVLGGVKIGSGLSVASDGTISASGGSGGTSDYTQLSNLPQINSTALVGNKSSSDLGLQSAITSSAKLSADVVDDTSTTHKFVTASDKTTWSGKQDAISDLTTIRSGANAGANAVQTIKINGTAQTKTDGVVNLPAYPTTLPASNTVSTYSTTGTAPVNGKAVKAALDTLGASSVGGTGKYISAISETGGIIFATPSQIDSVPTENSTNPVASGGTYTALSGKASAADQASDRAALIEIVDSGAKNLSQWNAGTGNGVIGSQIPFTTSGNLVVSFQSDVSTGYITLGFKNANNDLLLSKQINNSGTKIQEITVPSDVAYFNIVSSTSASYTNFMICTKAAWDISQTYQPYRPSYQELCARVAALENRGNVNA